MGKPPTLPMNREEGENFVLGYMDLISFECEVGAARGGNRVYPSPEDCLENNPCAVECGVVEVKVEAVRIVQESTAYGLGAGAFKRLARKTADDSAEILRALEDGDGGRATSAEGGGDE